MIRRYSPMLTGLLLAMLPWALARADTVLETDSLRLEIAENGTLGKLVAKPDGTEYTLADAAAPLAAVYRGGRLVPATTWKYAYTGRWVYRGGQTVPASRATMRGDRLTIEFGQADVTATYCVTTTPRYLAFELVDLEGPPIDRIDLLRLKLRRLPHLGEWVNVACDERFGICLCAGNVRTLAEMDKAADHTLLRASADKDVGFVGTTAVLFGCPKPNVSFLSTMKAVERDFHLPSGADNRRSPVQRVSYLWGTRVTPENIDEYIALAKRGGFRMILFSYTTFSRGAGHFEWNLAYPNGMADLKEVTDAIRRAGLKLGLHIHFSKAHRTDSYVTPIPDDRLHKVRWFTLAADMTRDATEIAVRETPRGCTLDNQRRLLMIGKELIAYTDYSLDPPYRFQRCERGHLGTTPFEHRKGTSLGLLDVDSWPSFIRYDQDTDIQDEVARRIADIYHQTGPYELIYFDGAEDVHAPYWYHVASAQHRVYSLLKPEPPACEAAHYTHFSWHMISRGNAYDIVAPADGMKDFCRLMPCRAAAARAMDFSRIQFGWLGRFGGGKAHCAGPDVWEYVASRAAAWDCPISLRMSPDEVASNPRAADCLDVIKTWEDAKLGNHLTDEQRGRLRNVTARHARYVPCFEQRGIWADFQSGREMTPAQQAVLANRDEHHLFVNEAGRHELVEIEAVSNVAQGAIKAFLFQREADPENTYALAWAVEGHLCVQFPSSPLVAMRPLGTPRTCKCRDDVMEVPIGPRTYLVFRGLDPDKARQLLHRAQIVSSRHH